MAEKLYTKVQVGSVVLEPETAQSTLYMSGDQGITLSADSHTVIVKTDPEAVLTNNTTGNAATASAFNTSSAIGASNKGVYIGADGKPTAMSFEVNATVPATAKFTDTNTKMTQTKTSTDAEYAVLGTAQTGTGAAGGVFSGNIKMNPATGTVTALKFKGILDGTVEKASRLGSVTLGSSVQPVWLSEGLPVVCDRLGTAAFHDSDYFMKASQVILTLTDNTPSANAGTGSAGVSTQAARADHVHPASDKLSNVSVGAVNQPVYFSNGEVLAGTILGSAAYKDVDYFVSAANASTLRLSSTLPVISGEASIGTAETAARADHVHPAQVSVTGSSGSCTGNAATATTASKLGTLTVGSSVQPVYLSSGLPVVCKALGDSAYHGDDYYALKEHGTHITAESFMAALKSALNNLTGACINNSVLVTDSNGNWSWQKASDIIS